MLPFDHGVSQQYWIFTSERFVSLKIQCMNEVRAPTFQAGSFYKVLHQSPRLLYGTCYSMDWSTCERVEIISPKLGVLSSRKNPKIWKKTRIYQTTPIQFFFFNICKHENNTQKHTKKQKKSNWGLPHPPTFEFFSNFLIFFNLTKPLRPRSIRTDPKPVYQSRMFDSNQICAKWNRIDQTINSACMKVWSLDLEPVSKTICFFAWLNPFLDWR